MTELDLQAVDLGTLALALEDHSDGGSWWIDADTGAVWCWFDDDDDDVELDPYHRLDARPVEALPSSVGYRDMEDFIAQVRDRRARELLQRAIAGRGAFRRFKDTLFELEDLRAAWFRFRDLRLRRRAIEFLVEESLVDPVEAARELEALQDPAVSDADGVADPADVAAAVAADLRRVYGPRLVRVVLYGSQARGDANPDSDVDLAVVLDEVVSPWDEGMERARRELAAARLLAAHDFGPQAVSRSYFAAFYAAEAALLHVGETRAKHSGVVSAVASRAERSRALQRRWPRRPCVREAPTSTRRL